MITNSYRKCICSSIGKQSHFCKAGVHFVFPPAVKERPSSFTSSPGFGVVSVPTFVLLVSICAVGSNYCFHLHFPDNTLYEVYFPGFCFFLVFWISSLILVKIFDISFNCLDVLFLSFMISLYIIRCVVVNAFPRSGARLLILLAFLSQNKN